VDAGGMILDIPTILSSEISWDMIFLQCRMGRVVRLFRPARSYQGLLLWRGCMSTH